MIMKKLASEIIAEQRAEIEEQIKFYERLLQSLRVDADNIEKKMNSLREYLDGLE